MIRERNIWSHFFSWIIECCKVLSRSQILVLFLQRIFVCWKYVYTARMYYRVSQYTWEFSDDFDIVFIIDFLFSMESFNPSLRVKNLLVYVFIANCIVLNNIRNSCIHCLSCRNATEHHTTFCRITKQFFLPFT